MQDSLCTSVKPLSLNKEKEKKINLHSKSKINPFKNRWEKHIQTTFGFNFDNHFWKRHVYLCKKQWMKKKKKGKESIVAWWTWWSTAEAAHNQSSNHYGKEGVKMLGVSKFKLKDCLKLSRNVTIIGSVNFWWRNRCMTNTNNRRFSIRPPKRPLWNNPCLNKCVTIL
jgi:hypothetical protein